jgi:hypothetical protein
MTIAAIIYLASIPLSVGGVIATKGGTAPRWFAVPIALATLSAGIYLSITVLT